MPNQIVLAWDVDVTGSSLGTAGAATAMSQTNVPLYVDTTTDPVLGQLFGLTVATDVSAASGPTTARRTLTLNMTPTPPGGPTAPPPFPCHPTTPTPPVLPFELRKKVTLPGSFFVTKGLTSVSTSASQLPSLSVLDEIEFVTQEGVVYGVASVTSIGIGLSTPFGGITGNTGAVKDIAAPATTVAVYSTSTLDTAGVASVPAIPAGSGARTASLSYKDSTGAGPFTITIPLTGKRPSPATLAGGSKDISSITDFHIASTGAFGNSVGQITLAEMSAAVPILPTGPTLTDFLGKFTDQAQMLIARHLVYLPPSYFALAQQGTSQPSLVGTFQLIKGAKTIPTTADQTAALAGGNPIQFASQLTIDTPFGRVPVLYTVAFVSPTTVTLVEEYTGDDAPATTAIRFSPTLATAPSNAQLSGPLAQFVVTEVAAPPPNPPLQPATVPVPTFLSDLFTQTLQLALAVPVVAQSIAFI